MTQEEFQLHVVDSLARLDTKMTDLAGNGKPGRVALLEKAVKRLEQFKYLLLGGAIAVSALVHFVFKY